MKETDGIDDVELLDRLTATLNAQDARIAELERELSEMREHAQCLGRVAIQLDKEREAAIERERSGAK